MTLKEQIIQEIADIPDALLGQLLDYVVFLKAWYSEEEITEEERVTVIASESAYRSGNFLTLDEYEVSQK
jgi:hypothetical protein